MDVTLAVAAALWAAWVFRRSAQADHDGPPIGALCMCVPAVVMLVMAGAIWPKTKKHPPADGAPPRDV